MAKWISGEELLTRWGIPPVRLIEHVMCGDLEPHNKKRRPYESDVLAYARGEVVYGEEPKGGSAERGGTESAERSLPLVVKEPVESYCSVTRVKGFREIDREPPGELEFWLKLLRLSMYKMEEVLLTEGKEGRPELPKTLQALIDWAADQSQQHPIRKVATARKLGDTWVIELGQELATCDRGGMKYIAYLLQHPGQRFKLLDLAEILEGVTPVCGDMGAEFDRQTRREITARYHELRGDIEEAEREGSAYLVQRYQEELEQLVRSLHKTLTPKQVKGILGKRGGTARAQDPTVKKEEKRIRKLLNDAYKKIGKTSPLLEEHLRRSITSVRDGGIAYNPDPSDEVTSNISQAA
jgi:hypothetical protein